VRSKADAMASLI